MNRFPCGVKHNFDNGVVFLEDRIRYDWNCTNCEIKEIVKSGKELNGFKTSRKVNCPILAYE
ncbi:MAG: hypothetical protein ACFFE4_13715 [Candidatus Thorarchaeota archaeon]